MPGVAAILRFSAVALLVWCGSVCAQSPASADRAVARKFDEFGSLGHCDLTARLDNLAIMVQNTPGAHAHIISYAPPGAGERLLEPIKDYLINMRGLPERRIKTTYGGRNSDLIQPKIELWVVPKGAPAPEPSKHKTNVETFKGLLADWRRADDFGVELEAEMGPGIGRTTVAAFVDVLNQQKHALGYIIVYSGEDLTPGAWKSLAQEEINGLQEFKVDTGRIKTVFGGHQKETRIQFWISPKDGPPPVSDAGPEQPLAKAIKAGDFNAYDLAKEKNQTNLLKRLTDILRTDKTLRAFLVVYLEVPISVEPTETDPEPIAEEPSSEPIDTPEPADLTKLVEKWRVELANTHKIGADRFIVVFTTAPEFVSSSLGLWIVPKGQPLPDPNETDEQGSDVEPPLK